MDLSIIIVNWNTRAYLRECLTSIPSGAAELSREVFVVDNASRDDSVEYVRRSFPGVRVIANSVNRGFAAANNQALREARGRYALLLNPDTRVHPGALKEMVSFMDRHPETGACGPLLFNEDGSVQHAARRFPTFAFALGGRTILGMCGLFQKSYNHVKMRGESFSRTMEVDQPSGAALMLRRSVLETVGLLDEGYFIFFEEVDLCHRIKAAGYRNYLVAEAHVTHYGGRSRRQNRARVILPWAESLLRYFRVHKGRIRGALFALIFKPLFILGIGAETVIATCKFVRHVAIRPLPRKAAKNRDIVSGHVSFLLRDALTFLLR